MFQINEGQEHVVNLLELLRIFLRAAERNSLWTKASKGQVYDYFQRCLAGDALDLWFDKLIAEETFKEQVD